jgi:hypothetical protein
MYTIVEQPWVKNGTSRAIDLHRYSMHECMDAYMYIMIYQESTTTTKASTIALARYISNSYSARVLVAVATRIRVCCAWQRFTLLDFSWSS